MRKPIPFAFAALLLGAVVQPAAADTYVGGNGVVGQNSLRDTQDKPAVTCVYDASVLTDTQYEGRIKRLKVRPPVARAAAGQQEIGWRFIVDRLRSDLAAHTRTTTTTYASGWQVAEATTSRNAQFTARGVSVKIPSDAQPGSISYSYTVRFDILWDAIGEPTGESIRRADYYRSIYHDYPWDPFDDVEGYCRDIFRAVRV